jgi:hypothetical protein
VNVVTFTRACGAAIVGVSIAGLIAHLLGIRLSLGMELAAAVAGFTLGLALERVAAPKETPHDR